ncbi:MAG: hypothetical protein LBE03_02780 [Candidatus Nomurabacteria bacterium]|jgi:tRNA G10  N-methylase Trm11|nr:hypothetical protein [Candidatus Nomurabacteria bacterium]
MNNEHIAILGRQPKLGLAELEAVYGDRVFVLTESVVKITTKPDLARLGGSKKIGQIIGVSTKKDILELCAKHIQFLHGKITVGFSAFNSRLTPFELQSFGIQLKKTAKKSGQSVRVIPNRAVELSTATSFHNRLGSTPNKIEFLLVEKDQKIIIATLTQTQNINQYRERDQKRPCRDAFVGMLPPKLAQIMLNLATGDHPIAGKTVLDPFCGTGVILQESLLLGAQAYGTDLNPKMVDYSKQNLDWLKRKMLHQNWATKVALGNATSYQWEPPIDFVVSETYLGQHFSAPPSPEKLRQVSETTQKIVQAFLQNLAPQIKSNTPICIAIPAWKCENGTFYHLKILDLVGSLGYNVKSFKHVGQQDLLYYRESQVVARELLVLRRK